ncbi:MAG: TIGR00296 family protein [Thermoplasmata archaeon]
MRPSRSVRTDPEGIAAVRLARRSLVAALGGGPAGAPPEALPPVFDEPRGAFVTLRRHPGGALRGCIGYPLPRFPLGTAISRAARAAAVDDPRFPPMRPAEAGSVTVEVSVLTVPELLVFATPAAALAAVRVGRDGLIVEGLGTSGLLLPQVAPEQGWNAQELLDGTCEKAGLPAGSWRSASVRVFRFEAEVFGERTPAGEVVRSNEPVSPADGRRAPRT